MNLKELIRFLNTVVEGIAETILTKPIVRLKGKTIKKFIPGVNGHLFVDAFKLDLINYAPIRDDEEYTVIVTKYEVEIRDKNGELVQIVKGQYIKEDKA